MHGIFKSYKLMFQVTRCLDVYTYLLNVDNLENKFHNLYSQVKVPTLTHFFCTANGFFYIFVKRKFEANTLFLDSIRFLEVKFLTDSD